MTWYDSSFKQRKAVAVDSSATGDGTVQQKDVEIQIPVDWDLFWNNIRSDLLDVICVDIEGTILSFARKAGARPTSCAPVWTSTPHARTMMMITFAIALVLCPVTERSSFRGRTAQQACARQTTRARVLTREPRVVM